MAKQAGIDDLLEDMIQSRRRLFRLLGINVTNKKTRLKRYLLYAGIFATGFYLNSASNSIADNANNLFLTYMKHDTDPQVALLPALPDTVEETPEYDMTMEEDLAIEESITPEKSIIPEENDYYDIEIIEPAPNSVEHVIAENELDYVIYVDKYTNQTSLYEVSAEGAKRIYECHHIDGQGGPEPRSRVGDQRTIEEVCWVKYITFIPEKPRDPLYGSAVIGLKSRFKYMILCGTDYPDRIIAIDEGQDITYSCPVYLNEDIEFIAKKVKPSEERTIIIIEDSRRPISGN